MAMDKKTATSELLKLVRDLDSNPSAPDSKDWRAAYQKVANAWENLRDVESSTTTATMGEFFSNIGQGLIDAQRQLDEQSEIYVKRALRMDGGGDGAVPGAPTMFRIPRVNAELKCSLEKGSEKSLNLVFYSDRQDVREMHQQTVQLEVVSVPAPPDYINALRTPPPPAPTGPEQDQGAKIGSSLKGAVDTSSEVQAKPPAAVTPTATPTATATQTVKATQTKSADDDFVVPVFAMSDTDPGDEEDARPTPPALPAGWSGRIADAASRAEARKIVEEIDLKQNGLRRSLVKDLLLPSWKKAVVLTDGQDARFIALGLSGKRDELLFWELRTKPPALQLFFRMPNAATAHRQFARLLSVVSSIGAAQEQVASAK